MPSHEKDRRTNRNSKARPKRVQNTRKKKTNKNNDGDRIPKALRTSRDMDNTQKTKVVKTSPSSNKSKKGKKSKNNKKKHPKLMMALKILIIFILLLTVIGAGVVAGMFFGLFGDEFEINKDDLKVATSNSVIVDQKGEVIANLSGDEKRKVVTLDEMSDYLPKAYVAIEDERFYKHNGVDFKRTAGAIVTTLMGKSNYGGSTITQQLVKNITKDDERSGMAGIFRKVKEWAKAYQVERMISKEQILELYLNILFVGSSNLHGVELGAEYYFNKSAKDLDLAECAFMAGINTSPNAYDPFNEEKDNSQKIKDKTKVVLDKMKELGYIENEEDYNVAVAKVEEGLPFQKGETATASGYSYHTDAIIEQVINQVMEEKDLSREFATNYVYSSGLTIYSTVDSEIQKRLEEEYAKEKYIKPGVVKKDGELLNDHTQSGMAVIDYKTGYVLGVAGGLGPKDSSGWNRATQMKKQTGSSIKIIADVAPALEEKVITPSTTYMDEKTNFGGNYEPKNDGNAYKNDAMNIREFIRLSRNIPALKIMRELTPRKSIEYLNKMGLSSINEEDDVLSLAIGGMTNGASPLEMAAAYGTIANDGVYITPTFYTKVVDTSGEIVLSPNQETTRVFSEQTAYLTKSIAQEPVKAGGTATYCAISGMDVAAKTGTTDNSYDRWLCGFTPYYAAATWFGYDQNEEVRARDFAQNPAGQIWDAVMTDIHKGLQGATFTRPSGIVEQTVCSVTGGIATDTCSNTYTEIFAANSLPDKCEGHGVQNICSQTNKEATQYCSQYCEIKKNSYGAAIPKERLNLWKSLSGNNKTAGARVNEICDVHTKPKEVEQPKPSPSVKPSPSASATPSPSSTPATPPSSAPTSPEPSASPAASGGED